MGAKYNVGDQVEFISPRSGFTLLTGEISVVFPGPSCWEYTICWRDSSSSNVLQDALTNKDFYRVTPKAMAAAIQAVQSSSYTPASGAPRAAAKYCVGDVFRIHEPWASDYNSEILAVVPNVVGTGYSYKLSLYSGLTGIEVSELVLDWEGVYLYNTNSVTSNAVLSNPVTPLPQTPPNSLAVNPIKIFYRVDFQGLKEMSDSEVPFIAKKCECGKEKHGFASHSTWCDMNIDRVPNE